MNLLVMELIRCRIDEFILQSNGGIPHHFLGEIKNLRIAIGHIPADTDPGAVFGTLKHEMDEFSTIIKEMLPVVRGRKAAIDQLAGLPVSDVIGRFKDQLETLGEYNWPLTQHKTDSYDGSLDKYSGSFDMFLQVYLQKFDPLKLADLTQAELFLNSVTWMATNLQADGRINPNAWFGDKGSGKLLRYWDLDDMRLRGADPWFAMIVRMGATKGTVSPLPSLDKIGPDDFYGSQFLRIRDHVPKAQQIVVGKALDAMKAALEAPVVNEADVDRLALITQAINDFADNPGQSFDIAATLTADWAKRFPAPHPNFVRAVLSREARTNVSRPVPCQRVVAGR